MGGSKGSSLIELIMVMLLLVFFSASIYTLIFAGSNTQKRILAEKEAQTDRRIALSALNIMIRQNDRKGVFNIRTMPATGRAAIMLSYRDGDESEHFDRWIYFFDGKLMEYVGLPDSEPDPELSFPLLEVDGDIFITYSETDNSVKNTAFYTDADGARKSISQTVYLRSEGGVLE